MSRFLVVKNMVNLETRFFALPGGCDRISAMRVSKDRERLVVGFAGTGIGGLAFYELKG
jgi:hypothetical protein